MIETTLPDNSGGLGSKPPIGGCLRARMNAATMTTIATINTTNEAMRPIAGIFSLIIKRLPTSLAGRVDYIISFASFAPDAVHQKRLFSGRKIVAKCKANCPVCSRLHSRLIGETRANGGTKNRGQKIGDRNLRDTVSVPYFLSDGRIDDQCPSLKRAG